LFEKNDVYFEWHVYWFELGLVKYLMRTIEQTSKYVAIVANRKHVLLVKAQAYLLDASVVGVMVSLGPEMLDICNRLRLWNRLIPDHTVFLSNKCVCFALAVLYAKKWLDKK
jgi:hypothetical protein